MVNELHWAASDPIFRIFGPCTAFVSGTNELTTAEHCVNENHNPRAYSFVNGLENFETEILAIRVEKSNHSAILRTEKMFDNFLHKGEFLSGEKASLAGFDPNQQFIVIDSFCDINESEDYLIRHTCDTVPGQSGSPIIQKNKVIGIHQGYLLSIGKNIGTLQLPRNSRAKENVTRLRDLKLEVDCSTDCQNHCVRKIGGIKVRNPVCEATCNTERALDCAKGDVEGLEQKLKNDPQWGECAFNVAMSLGTGNICGACVIGLTAATGGGAVLGCVTMCAASATFITEAKDKCGW